MRKSFALIPLMGFILVFAGCKTTKVIQASRTLVVAPNPVAIVMEKVQQKQPAFRTANVSKIVLDLSMGSRELSVSANCRIKKDSAIFVSIQPVFGIEMFKAELSPEKIVVIDKYNRRYYELDYSYISSRFGVDVDFFSIQSLLTAQLFCVGSKQLLPDSCKLRVAENGGNSILYETPRMAQRTAVSVENLIQQVVLRTKEKNYSMQADYADYISQNNTLFPQRISLKVGNDLHTANCIFTIVKLEFDTPLRLVSTPIDRYTKGDIEQLLKK